MRWSWRPFLNKKKTSALDQMAPSKEGADLNDVITSLPEILAKKANLEAHTNILQGVMREVAARDVPTFFEAEQGILQSGGSIDQQPAVLELLRDGSKGTIVDRTRLLACYCFVESREAIEINGRRIYFCFFGRMSE